jgi:L-iditol 2-dehydrogenase
MYMNAWVLHNINDFRFEQVEMSVVKEDEVLVRVRAVGICGSDIPRVYKTGTYSYPLIPGHEFSGEVAEVGANVEKEWLGKRVGVFPLIPCRQCQPCRNRKYEMCRHYSYIGSRQNGAFAEYVSVPKANLIGLEDNVMFEEAAMLEPMAVAVHAMRRVNISYDDIIVVCGLGTIGTLLVMFLLEAGYKNILAVGNKNFQKDTVLKLGIPKESYCDSRVSDVKSWVMDKTGGNGADVFFECVGRNETVAEAIDLAAPSGRVCLVGNPYSDMALDRAVYWKILRNQLVVTGTWNSSFTHDKGDDWHYVLDRLAAKKISPSALITHRYPLDEADKGFELMRDKREDYIKVIILNH